MSGPMIITRRRFLQQASALSAMSLASTLDSFGISAASAQGAPGYKALVCVFLFGGADSNNLVIPYSNYAAYNAIRDPGTGINIPQANLVQITPANAGGAIYGFHPDMADLQPVFNAGKMAVVLNAGPLLYPTTRAEYLARSKQQPSQLFSHSDQQQQFMSGISAPTLTGITGWGGRLAEKVAGLNAPNATPMAMSFSGSQTFGNGAYTKMLAMPTGGNFGFSGDPTGTPTAQQAARTAARTLISTAGDSNQIVQAGGGTAGKAITSSVLINPIIQAAAPTQIDNAFRVGYNGPPGAVLNSGIANQLKAVAKMINNRVTLGHSRQIFFVSIGGWDTHTGQMLGQQNLLRSLVPALRAFYQATVNMGIANEVTTFTLSDFSRTWRPNSGGTDHAWGGHYFVMGGSVLGNNFYGGFPDLKLGAQSINDSGSQGRWIPTLSLDQYGGTLAKWFGASPTDVTQIFPNIGRFATPDIGFMA
jgi:uncharacterized protein (DUF1501 family)